MREIRIPLDEFDLGVFLDRAVEFLGGQVPPEVDPTYAMVCVEHPGDVPIFGPEDGWDVLSALKRQGKMVFFPFAHADTDGTLTCADGNTYGPASGSEEYEEEALIGLEDAVGYLVQVKGGAVIMNSAIHAGGGCTGPTPSVDLYPDCGVLEQPMEKFVRSFIDD